MHLCAHINYLRCFVGDLNAAQQNFIAKAGLKLARVDIKLNGLISKMSGNRFERNGAFH